MLRSPTFLLLVGISLSTSAKLLNNNQLYYVPSNEQWGIANIERNDCDICTSDVYVKNGNVRINGVWVSGKFDFSINNQADFLFDSNTIFALGDVVKAIEINQHDNSGQ